MLFNSFGFLLLFLPITVVGFFFFGKRNETWGAAWLGIASIVFYGWWNYHYIPLLLASIIFNFWCGRRICESKAAVGRIWLIMAITINLALLAYYKYTNFFLASISEVLDVPILPLEIILPIGISFFTFTQIAFLVDTFQGKAREYRFIHYLLFVTYFPHLIAGPVLHHKEMMPQFADSRIYRFSATHFAIGLTIFIIGLVKKVIIADNIAPYASYLFDKQESPSLLIAWGGVIAYAFQLYFDFSGYSDMAIGLSRLFGVRLPLNFNSPYQSANIIEFWRRWHMTLSRFLRDYLYIAMGGNRHGQTRRYANLMVTMILGGVWHGAGWNYVIWGGLHGIFLIINHAWTNLAERINFPAQLPGWKLFSILLTFVSVCFAWVFFRSANMETAMQIIRGMTGGFGIGLPDAIGIRIGGLKSLLENAGVVFFLGGGSRFVETWIWTLFAALVVFFMPNTQQILRRFEPALDFQPSATLFNWTAKLVWTPSRGWAVFLGLLAVACVLSLNHPSEFLYFQF